MLELIELFVNIVLISVVIELLETLEYKVKDGKCPLKVDTLDTLGKTWSLHLPTYLRAEK
jgi:hypothetical protein